ncbi:hypothetical protein MTR_4g057860 [Medicago truncatula]|uniref:At1g61320/AtMIF1 LRR domain-containing protein n=1 Tax=Medicago truncatula TaxID=3880 RepID=G7IRC2_MEDTR|nr:hypothetical protein MTR_4g057860 [Medicago truncatula]
MASQHLQKLSLTVRNSHMKNLHMVGFQRQRTKCVGFSHDNLKYVELCGSVCTINVIDLASHLMRNVNSLKQITFNFCDKFYRGVKKWTEDSHSCWFDGNLI